MQLDFLKLCFFGSSCGADPPICASMPPLGKKIATVKLYWVLAPGGCGGMGIVKYHLSLPESAWLGLLLDNSWGAYFHLSTTGNGCGG